VQDLVVLTFPVWIDAELRVQFLVSLLFPDRLDVNCILMNYIRFLFSCHVKKKWTKKLRFYQVMAKQRGYFITWFSVNGVT